MNKEYARKVEILLRIIPLVTDEGVFAVHGGSAINLFVRDLPRYSVDIDLTYIPLEDRATSLKSINAHLDSIAAKARKAFRGMHIVPKPDICKQPRQCGRRKQVCGLRSAAEDVNSLARLEPMDKVGEARIVERSDTTGG